VQGVAPLHATDWRNSCREEIFLLIRCTYKELGVCRNVSDVRKKGHSVFMEGY